MGATDDKFLRRCHTMSVYALVESDTTRYRGERNNANYTALQYCRATGQSIPAEFPEFHPWKKMPKIKKKGREGTSLHPYATEQARVWHTKMEAEKRTQGGLNSRARPKKSKQHLEEAAIILGPRTRKVNRLNN